MSRAIVPVLGMHRSGTSAVAGALHHGGISMGPERSFQPGPRPENPKGFYEDCRFRDLNDLLCHRNGYVVTSWEPPPEIHGDGVLLRLRRTLLLRFNDRRFSAWGWKDPRTCLTFGLWASTFRRLGRLAETHVVFVVRDPLDVAASLETRNDLSRPRALDLWHTYNRRALAAVEAAGVPMSVVEYGELLRDPDEVLERLSRRLPALDPAGAARPRRSIRRWTSTGSSWPGTGRRAGAQKGERRPVWKPAQRMNS